MEHIDAIVVMGVSGAGKTTIAKALAPLIGGIYLEADEIHDENALTKMRRGIPLTDADRFPWLRRIAVAINGERMAQRLPITACSALRRRYRDELRNHVDGTVYFILLEADPTVLRDRLERREDHFMPASLLHSQLETLEPLEVDEAGLTIDAGVNSSKLISILAGHLLTKVRPIPTSERGMGRH